MKNFNLELKMLLTIMACMVLLFSELFAQENIDYKQLRDKEWIMELSKNIGIVMSYTYTIDSCFGVGRYLDRREEVRGVYYLSDDWNGTFDDAKVGNWVSGKYLIEKRTYKKENKIQIFVQEILKLTETDLELKHIEYIELTKRGKELSRDKKDEKNIVNKYKSKKE